jgi:hypothetical protein
MKSVKAHTVRDKSMDEKLARIPPPGWQVCDRATVTIATLLGWENRMAPVYFPQQKRDETMARVREWAKQAQ